MCTPKNGRNYDQDALAETPVLEERNGMTERRRPDPPRNGGRAWQFITDVLKLWPILLVVATFGWRTERHIAKSESFMEVGERFTPEDYLERERQLARELDETYMRRETLEERLNSLAAQLNRQEELLREMNDAIHRLERVK